MDVIYSMGAKFAGDGIGSIAYQAAYGLYERQVLARLLCGSYRPNEIPASMIRSLGVASRLWRRAAVQSQYLNYLYYRLYDRWAAFHLKPCDVFHGWGTFCHRSLQRAQALGAVTIVERASSHTIVQAQLLQTEYARWGLTYRPFPALLDRSVAEFHTADYVLIPSDFVRDSFLAQAFPLERLLQIPFGVDTHRFQPASTNGDRPFRLLFVGQINLRKGVLYLLQAWQQLNWRNAELWLVGPIAPELQPLLRPYRRLPGLRWIDFTPDLAPLYRQADVFVFPSIEEGSALVTYEALACGLPVVTTPNAGSVIRDGVEGYLAPAGNIDRLAGRLEQLRSDDSLHRQMGQAARRRALLFTWDTYRQRLFETLLTVVEGRVIQKR